MYAANIAAAKAHFANTDKYFALPIGATQFDDWLSDELDTLTKVQLKDASVWTKFVKLFKNPGVDDPNNGWRCEYWGKMMRGACFTYMVTKDAELYAVIKDTVEDMLTAQDPYGRFSTYSVEHEFNGWDLWGRKYILLGMEYFLEICDDEELQDRIVVALMKHVDYLIDKLGYEEDGKVNIAKATTHWDGLNSCSILEPVVFLYNITKEERFMQFAEYILSFGGTSKVNLFEQAYQDELPIHKYHVTKAYEMISCFEGLAEYNKVKPSEKQTETLIKFANRVLAEEHTLIGCLGCEFESFDYSVAEQCNEAHRGIMQETCVTVTWMKFLWQIFRLTGEGKWMDAFEVAAYNAMSASLKRQFDGSDNGGVVLPIHSYNPLRWDIRLPQIGGRMPLNEESVYGCCVCISSAGFALEALAAAALDKNDNVRINLYRNGTIKTPKATIVMDTAYPAKGVVICTVKDPAPGPLAISIRIPAWSKHTSMYVADRPVDAPAGTYVTIVREWKDGESIDLHLDMTLRMLTPQDYVADSPVKDRFAITRGPIVFAIDGEGEEEPKFAPVEVRELMASGLSKSAPIPCHLTIDVPHVDGKISELVDYSSAAQLPGHKLSCWMKID